MRTGNLYGGTAKDNNGFSSNKNYSNNNRNKKYPRSKHGNYGNSSRENNENNHSKNSGGGLSSSPPKTRKGNVTRIFPKFCIVNSDIYVSKAVVERNETWPPQLGNGVHVATVPHMQGRNKWKAVSYRSDSTLDIVIQPPTVINQQQQQFYQQRGGMMGGGNNNYPAMKNINNNSMMMQSQQQQNQ